MKFLHCIGALAAFCIATAAITASADEPTGRITKAEITQHPTLRFSDLLAFYAASNLSAKHKEVVDLYLRSSSQTYERYKATVFAHGDTAALEANAIQQFQARAAAINGTSFSVMMQIQIQPYDAHANGVPLFNDNAGVGGYCYQIDNTDTVSHYTVGTFGFANQTPLDYGFTSAKLCMSVENWYYPATQEQAIELTQAAATANPVRLQGTYGAVMGFHLSTCIAGKDEIGSAQLQCEAIVDHGWGSVPPAQTLVARFIQIPLGH